MRRGVTAATVLALLASTVQLVAPPEAAAAGTTTCNPDGNRWKGHASQSATQRHGAAASFQGLVLQLCTNPGILETSGSFAFSNVTPSDGGFNDIIQIGMGKCFTANCGSGMRIYSGWGRDSRTPGCNGEQDRFPAVEDQADWVQATHDYKIYHQNNWWRYTVDGVEYHATPEDSVCWTPRVAVWFGESIDYGDQIGGTTADKLDVTLTRYATIENGTMYATSFNAADFCNYGNGAPFYCDIVGTRALKIWTNR